jgi:hypothetical protein
MSLKSNLARNSPRAASAAQERSSTLSTTEVAMVAGFSNAKYKDRRQHTNPLKLAQVEPMNLFIALLQVSRSR